MSLTHAVHAKQVRLWFSVLRIVPWSHVCVCLCAYVAPCSYVASAQVIMGNNSEQGTGGQHTTQKTHMSSEGRGDGDVIARTMTTATEGSKGRKAEGRRGR